MALWVIPIVVMDYEHADHLKADDRGRVTLGKEHANSHVSVAWMELSDPDPEHLAKPSEKERNKLMELYRWAKDNDYKPMNYDTQRGLVYTQQAEWVDADVKGLREGQADE